MRCLEQFLFSHLYDGLLCTCNELEKMFKFLRNLDWKILLFAVFGCYVVPFVVLGTLISTALTATSGEWGQPTTAVLLILLVLIPPLTVGYFTARYARSRPQLHVFLVWVIGFAVLVVMSSNSLGIQAVVGVTSFVLTSLGAFIWLRRSERSS